MRRVDAIRFLKAKNCYLLREGSRHSVFVNLSNDRTSSLPRHNEINDFLFKKICKDLGI